MLPGFRKICMLAVLSSPLVSGVGWAETANKSGQLIVVDRGNLFSESGVTQAKEKFARLQSKTGRQAMVVTLKELSPADAHNYAKIDPKDSAAIRRFWHDLAVSTAKTDQARGVYILVCRKPGGVEVLADKEMRDKGFNETKERQLASDLLKALRESAKEKTDADKTAAHDRALMSAVEYLEKTLPGVAADAKQSKITEPSRRNGAQQTHERGGGWGIGQWICLGIAVLAGVWVISAIFRAFSGGGGMASAGGFGGGGFFPSLLGGLFGAAAGMWIYDQFLGGHSSHGGDYGGGADYGDSRPDPDAGAGDFSGDEGAGGSFDGDAGGGDFGGGDFGGDMGGGDF